MTVSMLFKNGRLCEVTVPKRVLTILSGTYVAALLQSMGHATINKRQRIATAELQQKDSQESMQFLTRRDVLNLFGKPSANEESDRTSILTYKYKLKGTTLRSDQQELYAWARFIIRQQDGRVLRAEAKYASITISMNCPVDDLRPLTTAQAMNMN